MTNFAALIVTGEVEPARVLGMPWAEFAVRRCHALGASHIVLVVERVPRELVAIVDRLRAGGIALHVAREAADIADAFHPEEAVLVWSAAAIVDSATLADFVGGSGLALLTTVAADPRFERLDATDAWTGFARIDGGAVRRAAPTTGDWDLGATLARIAVQGRAARVAIAPEAVDDALVAPNAERAGRRIIRASSATTRGWGAHWLIAPAARGLATLARSRLSLLTRSAPWGVLAMLAVALVTALSSLPILAAAALLAAELGNAVTGLASRATGTASAPGSVAARATPFVAGVALIATFAPVSPNWGPLAVAIGLSVALLLGVRLRADANIERWLADVPGTAAIIGTGAVFGPAGLLVTLIAATLHAFAGLAWFQHRLSPVLTHRD